MLHPKMRVQGWSSHKSHHLFESIRPLPIFPLRWWVSGPKHLQNIPPLSLEVPPPAAKSLCKCRTGSLRRAFSSAFTLPINQKVSSFSLPGPLRPPFPQKILACLFNEGKSMCDLGRDRSWGGGGLGSPKRAWGQVFLSARLKEAKISGNSPFAPKRKKKNQQQAIMGLISA